MPKVVLYVPVALHREVEELAGANGYSTADDMIRALSLATIDELVTGVAMSRQVVDPLQAEPHPGYDSEAAALRSGAAGVGAPSASGRASSSGVSAPDNFKPDFKTQKKK